MEARTRRSVVRTVIVFTALVMSFVLGARGVAVVPRLAASLGVALVLIAAAQIWQRKFDDG